MSETIENSTEETRTSTDKAVFLEDEEKSRKSSAKDNILQTIEDSLKSLERSSRTSETAKESRKSSVKQAEVLQTVDESSKSVERSSRTSDPEKASRKSAEKLEVPQGVVHRKSVEKTPRPSATASESRGSQQRRASVPKSAETPEIIVVPPTIPVPAIRQSTSSPSKVPERPVPAPRTTLPKNQSRSAIQSHAANFVQRWLNFIPREYRGESWIYAAGYVFLYSLIMLFCMSTFGFICMVLYVVLVTLLLLRYFGIGPLVSARVSAQ